MKFAKELEEDLVPEWRVKYFDYKQGKKKVKAIARVLRNVEGGPKTPGRRKPSNMFNDVNPNDSYQNQTPASFTSYRFPMGRNQGGQDGNQRPKNPRQGSSNTRFMNTPPIAIQERTPLSGARDESALGRSYGSIIATPPQRELPHLDLPDPAMDPQSELHVGNRRKQPPERTDSDPYKVGDTKRPRKSLSSIPRRLARPQRAASTPGPGPSPKPAFLKRMFSTAGVESPATNGDVSLQVYRELDARQDEFFAFLDGELKKVEDFYKMKEKEASERLEHLKEQLHEMRDRRIQELAAAKRTREAKKSLNQHDSKESDGADHSLLHKVGVPDAIGGVFGIKPHSGKTTAAMTKLGSPSKPTAQDLDDRRDYTKREVQDHVPYRVAKRKLKVAMQEFYRGLELLKSYALLNRTAFRKINKKYDKAVNARPTGRYMSEKVNKAWFVQSEVVEGYIVAVEDLYARYFERGNHKIAVGKLRSKAQRTGAFTGSTFRNGLMLAAGLVFGIEGLVNARNHLANPDPGIHVKAEYLLQIYGGYFLGLILFLFFVLDCRLWAMAKINYVFIFEYDARHVLDWRQLAELPCFFGFLEGLILWLNFQQRGGDTMYIWWPIVLIVLTMIIMLFPGPFLYRYSRQWWAYSNWRLALAGLYPVEFRDFFLGDMYCSQTYAMGNIELFFCLYANNWNDPSKCNSSHSRLLGFFSALPAVWRALQCLRRYYDSRNVFPHLVNCGKYGFNILFYMSLSLWRIHKVTELKALFIALGTINSIYCSIWDLGMDFSLLNPYARYPLLRNTLGYRQIWFYYLVMILDPILRFNWIFYAIFSNDIQHSAILSFLVAFSEVCRRGLWTLIRVENEHCTNVGRFRASRDVPLPYSLPSSSKTSLQPSPAISQRDQDSHAAHSATGADIERTATTGDSSLRIRKSRTPQHPPAQTPTLHGFQRVGTIIMDAHAQDYEKKKRPGVVGDSPASRSLEMTHGGAAADSSDDEDDDEDGTVDDGETDVDGTDGEDGTDITEAQRMLDRAKSPASRRRGGSSSSEGP